MHVGIIPDGNRRLAKKLMERPWKGHEWGVGKIKDVLKWAKETGIKVITFYLLSLENLKKRPKREKDYLFSIARRELKDILGNKKHIIHKNRVKIKFFGRLDLVPNDLQELMRKVTEMTKNYSNYFLNLAIAYGGRQEIVDASKRLAIDVKKGIINPEKVDEKTFREYLWSNGFPDPDLIIRTGGEKRISNFLIFQSSYSELVFFDVMWPEFCKRHFFQAIEEFKRRERRFGR